MKQKDAVIRREKATLYDNLRLKNLKYTISKERKEELYRLAEWHALSNGDGWIFQVLILFEILAKAKDDEDATQKELLKNPKEFVKNTPDETLFNLYFDDESFAKEKNEYNEIKKIDYPTNWEELCFFHEVYFNEIFTPLLKQAFNDISEILYPLVEKKPTRKILKEQGQKSLRDAGEKIASRVHEGRKPTKNSEKAAELLLEEVLKMDFLSYIEARNAVVKSIYATNLSSKAKKLKGKLEKILDGKFPEKSDTLKSWIDKYYKKINAENIKES